MVMISMLVISGCSKDEETPSGASIWNLSVKTLTGTNIAIATGDFTFTTNTFTALIKTSVLGTASIVKEFSMSGLMVGDTIVVEDFIINLTDPVEVVDVSGRVTVTGNNMAGGGTYSIVQPPDTLHYYGTFVMTGAKQ